MWRYDCFNSILATIKVVEEIAFFNSDVFLGCLLAKIAFLIIVLVEFQAGESDFVSKIYIDAFFRTRF